MSTTESKSIFSRIISYITSWFMYIVQSIYSLYKDELERQSRDETDYKKWKLYEEIQRTEQTQQYDEESVLGGTCPSPSTSTVSIKEQKLASEKVEETSNDNKITLDGTTDEKQEPIVKPVTSKEKIVEKKEETPIVIIKPKVVISTTPPVVIPPAIVEKKTITEQESKPIKPIVEETKKTPKETITQLPPKASVKEQTSTPQKSTSHTTNASTTQSSSNVPEKPVSKPAEISGLIGERLKMKKFRNFSGNAYNSLIKPSSNKEEPSNKKEAIVPTSTTQEVIQQSNTQLIQRKLSSKPKKISRRPSQQTIKHSDVLAKLEEEATIDLPDVEKFNELEEFSQLEKKVGLENAIKQMKEKKETTTAPPPPPLSQVINVNVDNSPSKSSTKVTLGAILNAKSALRKTTEEWK